MRTAAGLLTGVLAAGLAACGPRDAAAPNPPSAVPNVSTTPDTSRPVASGNTPAAADIAAVAALKASFDPSRDPAADLEMAKVEAARGGKYILLDVGNQACGPCRVLDALVEGDAEIRSFRDASFVWMKVDDSEGNRNERFLSRYPPVDGHPHLFVLDADGKLLHSQFTAELEKGKGYDRGKVFDFLRASAPAP